MSSKDCEFLFFDRTKIYFCLQLVQLDRKIDPVHLVRNNALQVDLFPLRADDGDLIPGYQRRLEKRKSLDVVPVRMSNKEVGVQRFPVRDKMIAQTPYTGSRIENDQLVIIKP